MKKIPLLFLLLSPTFVFSQQKNWAFGAKLGEPAGFNITKYLDDNKAIQLNFGTYGGFWGQSRAHGSRPYQNTGLAINANLLLYPEVFTSQKIKAFYGAGLQVNSRRSYPDRLFPNYEKTISLGANALAGLEYFPESSPISFFVDAGFYLEVVPLPLFSHFQSGIGARFNF